MLSVKPICLMALFITLTALPGTCPAQDSGAVLLNGIEARYAGKTFSATFNQTARLAALEITEKAQGKVWFSHPGKMRWQYLTPDRHEIITNGKQVWLFRPDENQVMIGSAAAFFKPGAGGAFLSDITRIRKDFSIEAGQQDEGFAELVLTPKKQMPELSGVTLTIALPSHDIQMVVTENIYGDTTRFIFTDILFAPPDPAMFDFIIPDGTSVIEMQ
jgi:outer membrane lipoprotein carrier protein